MGKARLPGILITSFFCIVFFVAVIVGWEWPYIAKLMPVYFLAIPGILLCLGQLCYELFGAAGEGEVDSGGVEMDEVFKSGLDSRAEIRRTLAFLGWLAGGALAVWLFGIVVALPLLVLLYARIEGREPWVISIVLAVGIFAFLWGVFQYILDMRWPAGLLFR